ncbi:TetR/AcrR family transcriptional regulator [Hydrogenimonas sp.]|uniref:TetR/AcrR family transcriptional regulator n=1 Tax=Hydrogenimonas sp. TaxID=2231112 RepID=UPI00260AF899|nr:TetR/AcrR family transcriptional regulator [Hydrogenimonas sp.]
MKGNKKEKILEAAAIHFARRGYANASLEEIAADAGVTKPAIYYHFKDKAALYESVLCSRLERLADAVGQAVEAHEAVEKRVKAYIESFGAFLAAHRCFAAMLSHEFADNGRNLSDDATRQLSRTLGLVTRLIDEGVKRGVFEIENPMVVQMMIVSTLINHQTTRTLRKRVATQAAKELGGVALRPEPDMNDLSKILAKKILKLIRKERP